MTVAPADRTACANAPSTRAFLRGGRACYPIVLPDWESILEGLFENRGEWGPFADSPEWLQMQTSRAEAEGDYTVWLPIHGGVPGTVAGPETTA